MKKIDSYNFVSWAFQTFFLIALYAALPLTVHLAFFLLLVLIILFMIHRTAKELDLLLESIRGNRMTFDEEVAHAKKVALEAVRQLREEMNVDPDRSKLD